MSLDFCIVTARSCLTFLGLLSLPWEGLLFSLLSGWVEFVGAEAVGAAFRHCRAVLLLQFQPVLFTFIHSTAAAFSPLR